jgi:hypothetical protein
MDEDKMLKLLNNADPEAVARAMQNTTMQEMADSAARSLALEQIDENKKEIKLKLKPKKRSDKDEAIMLAERQRRARAKNKAKPMGKKDGGMVKGYMGGGSVHKNNKDDHNQRLGSIKKNIMSYQSAENAHTSDWVSRMAVKAAIAMEK